MAIKDSIYNFLKIIKNKHQTKFSNLARLSLFGTGTITNLSSYYLTAQHLER